MKREIPANFYLDPTKNEHLGTSLFCPEASVHQPNQVLRHHGSHGRKEYPHNPDGRGGRRRSKGGWTGSE